MTVKRVFEHKSKALTLDVLSVGNANVDLMINHDSLAGDLTPVLMPGGSACNFSVGCSRLGLKAGFLGFLGRDYFSRFMLDALKREGVKALVKHTDADTGFVVVFTKKYFKKYVKYIGANAFLDKLNIKPYLGMAKIIHLATPPLSLLSQVVKSKAIISLDPGSTISSLSLDVLSPLLKRVSFFFPNETEAKAITGHDYKIAAREFLNAGVSNVIIKRGCKGCYFLNAFESFSMSALDYPVIDTTGAGDAFASAFITAWLKGKSMLDSCRWGIISSSVCVSKLGAQASVRLNELNDLYRKYFTRV